MAVVARKGRSRPTPNKAKINSGYRFKDKDPIIDTMMSHFHGSQLSYGQAAWEAGLSETTIRNWDSGTTMQPQYRTVVRFMTALGLEFGIYSRGEVDELHRNPSMSFAEAQIVRWRRDHKERQPEAVIKGAEKAPEASPASPAKSKGKTK